MSAKKQNATGKGGAQVTQRAGRVKGKKGTFLCGVKHTSDLRREVHDRGLALSNTSGMSQRDTLLRVLQYLGPRGLNTPEGVGLGFYRIATRIQELEELGWVIASLRETLIGADGYKHSGIARYVLKGRTRSEPRQHSLDLGVPC